MGPRGSCHVRRGGRVGAVKEWGSPGKGNGGGARGNRVGLRMKGGQVVREREDMWDTGREGVGIREQIERKGTAKQSGISPLDTSLQAHTNTHTHSAAQGTGS